MSLQTQSKEIIKLEKYKQLISNCILHGSDEDGKITKTKLAKLVYLVDFAYFYSNLKSVSGFKYLKLDHGPVPMEYFAAIDSLAGEEQIFKEQKGKSEMISLLEKGVKDNLLSREELALTKKICAKWKKFNTKEIVDFTHKQVPWMISFEKDEIPYELITQEEPENVY